MHAVHRGIQDPLDYTKLYNSSSSSTWLASQGIARPAMFMQRKVSSSSSIA
jgi:hypothetical protein